MKNGITKHVSCLTGIFLRCAREEEATVPSYDFRCDDCGEEFTVFVAISKKDEVQCADCGGDEVRQLVTTFYHSGSSSGESGASCTRSTCGSCTTCRTPG